MYGTTRGEATRAQVPEDSPGLLAEACCIFASLGPSWKITGKVAREEEEEEEEENSEKRQKLQTTSFPVWNTRDARHPRF